MGFYGNNLHRYGYYFVEGTHLKINIAKMRT